MVSSEIVRPNVRDQLLRLRDFQRDTVEYVFSRMYDSAKPAYDSLLPMKSDWERRLWPEG